MALFFYHSLWIIVCLSTNNLNKWYAEKAKKVWQNTNEQQTSALMYFTVTLAVLLLFIDNFGIIVHMFVDYLIE